MTIEVAMVISFVSVAWGIYQGVLNLKRNEKNDIKNDVAQLTTVIVKLENISTGVNRIESEMKNVKTDIKDLTERLGKAEASTSSAHKRLDTCEKYCKRFSDDDE